MNEHKSWEEKTPEERAEAAAKLKACNDRCYARMAEINRIASETLVKTTHGEYEPGQCGEDYRTFGKAICEIRKLVKDSIADVAPDYEMLARQFARPCFDADKMAKAIEAVASEQPVDYPTFYTPGCLCDLAQELEAQSPNLKSPNQTIIPGCPSLGPKVFPSGADVTAPAPEKLAEFCQSELQREEARRLRKIVWRAYATKGDPSVMGKTRQNDKVYEVRIAKRQADVSDTYAQLKVNGKTVLTGSFIGGAWMAKRMMTAAAQALVNHKAKLNRDSRRNYKKRAAAAKALVEKELA